MFNKDAQKKVRDEILRVLGDDLTPSMEQQKELKYMNMVIYENLRLHPPVCVNCIPNICNLIKLFNLGRSFRDDIMAVMFLPVSDSYIGLYRLYDSSLDIDSEHNISR